MATYSATFATDTVGAAPAGWTSNWDGAAFTVVADATATGGKVLRAPSVSGKSFLSWGAVPAVADFEMLSRFRIGSSTTGRFWMAGRGNASVNSVHAGIYNGATSVLVARFVNGTGGLVTGASAQNPNLPVGTWFRQRMRVTGTQVWYRVWAEGVAEPSTWTIGPLTDNALPAAAGWVGIMVDGGAAADRDVDWITVGTAGDAAPDPTVAPPATSTTNVFLGGTVASEIRLGANPVDAVYVGSTLAWGTGSSTPPPPAGTVDTANLQRVWHYENLAVGGDPVPNPWSEFHGLRTDQREVISSPVFPGTTRSLRFNVRPGDTGWGGTSGTLRSEVRASIAQSGSPTEGTDQWWAWPTYFTPDFHWDERNQFLIFTQWHQTANSGNPNVHFWASFDDHVMLDIRGGTGGVTSGDAQYIKTYDLGPINKGAWMNFLVRIVWGSTPSTGRMEVWIDGVQVHAANDATLYVGQSIYIKQGIYSAAGAQVQHFITHGPLRLGSTRAAVENLPPLV